MLIKILQLEIHNVFLFEIISFNWMVIIFRAEKILRNIFTSDSELNIIIDHKLIKREKKKISTVNGTVIWLFEIKSRKLSTKRQISKYALCNGLNR